MNISLECYTCRKEQAVEVNQPPTLAVELCGIADAIGWKSLINLRTGKAYVFVVMNVTMNNLAVQAN